MDSTKPNPNTNPTSPLIFKSAPNLLHLCVMDSMMPSPSRHLEGSYEPMGSSSEGLFINKDPGSLSSLIHEQTSLVSPISLEIKDTSTVVEIVTPAVTHIEPLSSPRIVDKLPEVNPHKEKQGHPIPKGAWASPLNLSTFNRSLANSSDLSQQNLEDNHLHGRSVDEQQWPSLSSKTQSLKNRAQPNGSTTSLKSVAKNHVVTDPVTKDIITASQDYPWAAKMRSMCNLRRVTTPVFMDDGTPKVSIPSHVLLEGLENQKEFVVGQFYRCAAPSGGLIHAVVTRIWGRKCRIFTRKIGETSYLFHIPDESTRKWVLQRGLWHVDDCLMFVSAWSPSPTISLPEISTVPVWLTLKNIPNQLYSIKGINWIASGIGEPMLTNKPWLDPTQMGEAKILVEVKLNKPFPQKVALEDESGNITMVDVVYSWLPSKCASCGQLGHKSSRCLGLPAFGNVYKEIAPIIGDTSSVSMVSMSATVPNTTTSPRDVEVLVDVATTVSEAAFVPMVALASTTVLTPSVSSPVAETNIVSMANVSATITDKSTTTLQPNPAVTIPTTTETETITSKVSTLEIAPLAIASYVATPTVTEAALITIDAPIATENESTKDLSTLFNLSVSPSNVMVNEQGNFSSPPSDLHASLNMLGNTASFMSENNEDDCVGRNRNQALLEVKETIHEDASLQMSRGGRPIKPTQKIQEMQWTLVEGRGKRGRGSRGGRG